MRCQFPSSFPHAGGKSLLVLSTYPVTSRFVGVRRNRKLTVRFQDPIGRSLAVGTYSLGSTKTAIFWPPGSQIAGTLGTARVSTVPVPADSSNANGSTSLGDTTGNSAANSVRRTPDTALLNGYEVVGWSENSATPLVREAAWWLIKPDGSGLVDKYNFGYGYSDTTGDFKVRLRLIDRLHRDSNPLGIGGRVFTEALAINKNGAILATGSRYGQSGKYALIIPRGGGAGEL